MIQAIAQRGLSSRFPENTLLAFEQALLLGADGATLDVQLSADHVPVVFHDENLLRITGDDILVRELTVRELKSLDVSGHFRGHCPTQRIPTLEEYFALVRKKSFLTIIELQTLLYEYPGIEQHVIDMIDAFRLNERVILSSFNHYTLLRCKALAPDLPRGIAYDCRLAEPQAYAASLGMQFLHPNVRFLNDAELEKYAAAGMQVNPWTVDDEPQIKKLLNQRAVHAILSTRPERIIALQNRK